MTDTTNGQDIMYGQYNVPPPKEMVKFGVGQPSTQMLPLELIRQGMDYTRAITNPSLLQYGDIPGYAKFDDCLAKYLSNSYEHQVNPDELFITNGNTDAVAFFCSLFTSGREVIVYVEEPTYFLALNIFKDDFKLKTESIPICNDGIDMDELEMQIKQSAIDYPNALRVLYTVPTFHNPTSYTMSHEKRLRLGKLANSNENFIILADEVYQLLYFNSNHKPSLPLCYYTDKAISMGSFSKILAPSLRLGWMQIKNKDIMNIFKGCGQMDSSGGKSPFVQSIVHGVIMSGGLDANIVKCRNFLGTNCRALSQLVMEKLSDYVEFIEPSGGYFLWLKLKEPFKSSDLVEHSAEHLVQFIQGTKFSAHNGCNDYIRLSFSYYDSEGFDIGIDRMVNLFKSVKEKYREETEIRTLVCGSRGKLGLRIAELMKNDEFLVMTKELGRCHSVDQLKYKLTCVSVIIDVSSVDGLTTLLTALIDTKLTLPLVIGTTGDLPMDLIKEYSKVAPVALVSNFSEGVSQTLDLLKTVNEDLWKISMVETHHTQKKDAPSGTAKTLASAFDNGVNIESRREGDVIGTHSITLDSEMESIEITHNAKNRDLFAEGALKYVKWIINQPSGLYTSMKPQELHFSKYSGCGNDFIIVLVSEVQGKYPLEMVLEMCSRKTSVGADGLITVEPYGNDIRWTYYNSDGSNVEMCGNGARCVVQYCLDKNLKTFGRNFTLVNNFNIETRVIFEDKIFYVQMPNAKFKKFIDETHSQYSWSIQKLIEVGVPHFVFEEPEMDKIKHPSFHASHVKNRTGINANTNLYFVDEETKQIHIRTHERGVNQETLACGTGCCAVAFNEFNKSGNAKRKFELIVKSGDLITVLICPDVDTGDIIPLLSGPAKKIFNAII